MTCTSTVEEVREHYTRYATLLDEHVWAEWLQLFAEDATYRVTTRDNELRNLPAGILLCTNRMMLADRVDAGQFANIYRKHTNRHLLGLPTIERADSTIRSSCPFCVVQTEESGAPFIFAVGRYMDELLETGSGLLIQSKAVVLDNSRIMTSMPLPL